MRKIVIAAVIVFIIGLTGTMVLGGSLFSFGPEVTIDESKTVNGEEIKHLDITSDIGDINISESDSNQIEVRIQGSVSKIHEEHYVFEIEKSGDTLFVKSLKDSDGFFNIPWVDFDFGGDESRVINIKLPQTMLEQVDIKSNIGNIDIESPLAEELAISTDVGDIEMEQFKGNSATIETNVGHAEIKHAVGEVDIQTNTGDIELEMDEVSQDVKIRSNVGEVYVKVNDANENISIDANSDVGEVEINGGSFLMGENENGPTISIKTDVGDIIVEK